MNISSFYPKKKKKIAKKKMFAKFSEKNWGLHVGQKCSLKNWGNLKLKLGFFKSINRDKQG
jgi:hypothetical protein